MGRMRPVLNDAQLDQLKSRAEAKFFRACQEQLPDSWLVLFSTPWVGTMPSGRKYDGEADFIIFGPGVGMLVVEVKGGGISYSPENGKWWSTDRHGAKHEIKDPFRQATAEKHSVLGIIQSDRRWSQLRVQRLTAGHAVMLPDVEELSRLVTPQSPRGILGGRAEMDHLAKWIRDVLGFWVGKDGSTEAVDGQGLKIIEQMLCSPIEVRPLLAAVLEQEEEVRIRLTEQQARVLRALGSRNRASIAGGAGTGKTLLAIEKARELASEGKHTLLICYNRLLADYFKTWAYGQSNLFCMTFHQLCDWFSRLAKAASGRDLMNEARRDYPGRDAFDVHAPFALAVATEVVNDRFDAIIVDEGQDFREEYWLGVELLLRDPAQSVLYIFHDQNQRLYRRTSTFPIKDDSYVLSFNCRNTRNIHLCAYRFFSGDRTDPPPGLEGDSVGVLTSPSRKVQGQKIHDAVVGLLDKERLKPSQVCVLVAGTPKEEFFDVLLHLPLPRAVEWCVEPPAICEGVRVDTVRRFKGLEADAVFLWGVAALAETDPEMLYVGASRAKGRLWIVGDSEACEAVRH